MAQHDEDGKRCNDDAENDEDIDSATTFRLVLLNVLLRSSRGVGHNNALDAEDGSFGWRKEADDDCCHAVQFETFPRQSENFKRRMKVQISDIVRSFLFLEKLLTIVL